MREEDQRPGSGAEKKGVHPRGSSGREHRLLLASLSSPPHSHLCNLFPIRQPASQLATRPQSQPSHVFIALVVVHPRVKRNRWMNCAETKDGLSSLPFLSVFAESLKVSIGTYLRAT